MGFPVKVCSVCSVLVHVFILTQLTALGQEYTWDDSFDYIVVGGGTAGSVLAARLSEDPQHTVLLLEAGIDYEYILATDVPFAMPWLQDESLGINWGFTADRQEVACKSLINQQVLIPQGKILGGTSSINGMKYIRGSREDFDYWSYLGNEGWSYDEVLPYFMKSEHNMVYDDESRKYMNNSYHSWSGMWPVEKVTVYPELVEAFLDAHSDLGYMTTDLNGQNATGAMPSLQTSKRGRRMNTAKAFLKPVMYARDNLHVRTMHYVEKILLSGTTAQGVSVNDTLMNKMLHIEARKEVIVSAGAINSPKLLMLSGIGPIDHLESMGIPVAANLPVGSHLADHIMTDLSFEFNPKEGLTGQWWNIFSFDALQEYHFSGTGPWSSTGLQAVSLFSLPEEVEDEEVEVDLTTQQPHTVLEVLFSCNFENTSKSRKQVDGEVLDKSSDCAKLEQQTFVDDFNWTLWSGRTPSDGTGPSKDHTNNISDSGMYMYIEASGISPYMNASLTSPFIYLEDGSQGMCLTFFYHMLGKHLGSLTVSEIQSDEQIEKVWRVAKENLVKSPGAVYGVDEWVSVSVNLSSKARAVRFTAMRGGTSPWHPFGDIAIDDIVILRGACGVGSPSKKPEVDDDDNDDKVTMQPNPQTGSVTLLDCTFDSPSDQLCNFSQVMTGINDDLDWGRLNGGTPTSFTGPLHDHTQGNLSGYYIYVESSGVDPDKMAKIVTPELSGQQSHSMCLSFYYHMWGHNIGSLYVEEMHAGGRHVKVWEKKYNQLAVTEDGVYGSADWQSAEFDISQGTERVLFTAVKGGKPEEAELQPYGDIALDDIKVRTYPCNGAPGDNEETTTVATTTSAPASSVLSCTFDGGMCGFSALDNRTWTHHSGATPTVNTGPREDHTKGDSSGKYLYAEATEKNPGERFNVRTPQLNSTGTAPLCLKFYYHMYGQHLGSLNVYQKHGDDAPSIVWIMTKDEIVAKSGQNDGWDMWLKAEAMLAPGTDYLIFSATRGGDDITEPYGDIAIDDVMITEGVCASQPAESLLPVSSKEKLVECDFDLISDPPLCSKRQPSPADGEDQFDWRRRSGKTPSSFTGPLNDNSNHANGSYMYIEASGRSPNDSAKLYITSPQLWMYTSGAACLTFHYHMYGKHIGGLYLYNVDQRNASNFMWEKDVRHLIQINEIYGVDKWMEEEISVPANTTGFVFVGVRGGSTRGEPFGDIAIDDILVTSGTCGQQPSADVGNNGGGDNNNIEWVTEQVTQPTTPQSQTERPAMPSSLMIELIAMLMGNIPSNVTYVPNIYGFKPEVYTALHDQEANKYGALLLLALEHPRSQGSVRLSSTSPYDKPHIKLNYLQDEEDVKEMIRGVRFIQKLMQTSAFSELGARYSTPHHPGCIIREDQSKHIEFDSDEYWECYIRHNTLTNYHYTSTCRMGPHAEVAVVDRKLRVHGISNLRVVDASVMPKIISGNTMATTVMIAEKAADFIKQENEPMNEDENTVQVQGKEVTINENQRSMPGPYGLNKNIKNNFEKSLDDAAMKNLKQRSMPGPYSVDKNIKNDVEKSLEHLKTLLKNIKSPVGKGR